MAYYRQLIALRRFSEYRHIIADGDFNLLCPGDDQVFAYFRRGHGKTLLVACNVSLHPASLQVSPELRGRSGETVVSNYQDTDLTDVPDTMELRPFEATVLCL